jgi:VIT1/CCC1 family predicted Fe2+/Mn2+ transporter
MKRAIIAGFMILAGCSEAGDYAASTEAVTTADIAEEAAAGAPPPPSAVAARSGATGSAAAPATPIPVSIPRIAYVYEFGYRLAADRIPEVQRKHADLCESKGPQVCRILDMRQSGSEGDYAHGSLNLAVAAPQARAFGAELSKAVGDADGDEISSAISGEDLSKQIVDTEARLRARTVLRDRLLEVLRSRKGTVAELVEAERGVAQVNEEIDQARSWLTEMQGRVDFSRVNVSYSSGSPAGGGFMEPIRGAIGSIGSILGMVFAFLIVALTVLIPIGLIVWGIVALIRKLRGRPALTVHAAQEPVVPERLAEDASEAP